MKRAIIIGVLLVSYFQIQAQKIGVVAGVNMYKPTFENRTNGTSYQYGLGYQIGLKTILSINDKFAFTPQLYYTSIHPSLKGAKLQNSDRQSLRLPIMLQVKVSPKLALQVGPSIDYELRKNIAPLKKTLVRGAVGLSYQFSNSLELNAQYIHSLYNELTEDTPEKLKSTTMMFTLGYYFKK
jgi:Outer membrane protein beta-barrel domain